MNRALLANLRVLTLTDIAMLSPVVMACRDERDGLRAEVGRIVEWLRILDSREPPASCECEGYGDIADAIEAGAHLR